MRITPPTSSVRRAVRITALVISTGAALTSILSFARAYGLVGEAPPSRLTVGDLGVSWVALSPATDTVTALGDTIHVAATITDKRGTTLVGATVAWSSDEPGIAEVDDHGLVIARAPGAATILAAAGAHTGRAHIIVRQHAVRVRIAADSALHVGEGKHRRFEAMVTDRRGFVIAGRAVRWNIADSTVATVDSLGVVTGRAVGRTVLGASADGVGDEWPIEVVAVPGALALVNDAPLRAAAGGRVAQPVAVRVASTHGRTAAGIQVRFRLAADGGSVTPSDTVTDADGVARAAWVLGTSPGRQRLTVSATDLDSTLVLTAEADPVAANLRYERQDTGQSGTVGALLPSPVAVRVTDSVGRALADVPVSWSTVDGGNVSVEAVRTDSMGEARARWTLGPKRGVQRLRVQAGNPRAAPSFVLTALAASGSPSRISVVEGAGQTGRVGAALPRAVAVRVVDATGNPVPGVRVMAAAESGSSPDSLATTDSSGVAHIRWRLGRVAGAQRLHVRPEHGAAGLVVTAVARSLEPANVEISPTPSTGTAGRPLGHGVTVRVTDAYANAVPDVAVRFASRAGSVSPRLGMTDANGRVNARWTLGSKPGDQILVVTAGRSSLETRLTVRVTGR